METKIVRLLRLPALMMKEAGICRNHQNLDTRLDWQIANLMFLKLELRSICRRQPLEQRLDVNVSRFVREVSKELCPMLVHSFA